MKALVAATGMAAVAAALGSWSDVRFWRAWLGLSDWPGRFASIVLIATLGSVATIISAAAADVLLTRSDLLPTWSVLIPVGIISGMAAVGNWGARRPKWLRAASYGLNLTRRRVFRFVKHIDDDACVKIESEIVWRIDQVQDTVRDAALCSIARQCGAASRNKGIQQLIKQQCNILLTGTGQDAREARARLVPLAADAIRVKRRTRLPTPADWGQVVGTPWPSYP